MESSEYQGPDFKIFRDCWFEIRRNWQFIGRLNFIFNQYFLLLNSTSLLHTPISQSLAPRTEHGAGLRKQLLQTRKQIKHHEQVQR